MWFLIHLRSEVAWIARHFGLPSLEKTCFWGFPIERPQARVFIHVGLTRATFVIRIQHKVFLTCDLSASPPGNAHIIVCTQKAVRWKWWSAGCNSCPAVSAWSRAPEQRGRLRHSSNMNRLQKTPFFYFFWGGEYCVFLHLTAKSFGFSIWGGEVRARELFFLHNPGKSFLIFLCLLVNCPFFSPLMQLFY